MCIYSQRVLAMAASPGGKTSHIAARMADQVYIDRYMCVCVCVNIFV